MELPSVQEPTYRVNDLFYTLQGEGVRAGTPAVFLRFQGCNLKCDILPGPGSPGGFACDTEFASGSLWTIERILQRVAEVGGRCRWVVLTGGEPGLQVDRVLVDAFHAEGYSLAIETNGTVDLSGLNLDWITLSPKVAEHALKQHEANELKYVRGYGQGLPVPSAKAEHCLISPAFHGGTVDAATIAWCVGLCLANPPWRLSVQVHQLIGLK